MESVFWQQTLSILASLTNSISQITQCRIHKSPPKTDYGPISGERAGAPSGVRWLFYFQQWTVCDLHVGPEYICFLHSSLQFHTRSASDTQHIYLEFRHIRSNVFNIDAPSINRQFDVFRSLFRWERGSLFAWKTSNNVGLYIMLHQNSDTYLCTFQSIAEVGPIKYLRSFRLTDWYFD